MALVKTMMEAWAQIAQQLLYDATIELSQLFVKL